MNTWYELLLRERTIIRGVWNGTAYTVVSKLGQGANGSVYLVERAGVRLALKISADSMTLQSEINVLQTLRFDDGKPYVLDVDDVHIAGEVFVFYVMRWVEGCDLASYIARYGRNRQASLGAQILRQLHVLHQQGYAFADLKSENVLVERIGKLVLVDYGGVTAFGRSVRQFTERTDRGFWRAGERTADAAYDLFAFAVVWVECMAAREFANLCRQPAARRTLNELLQLVNRTPGLHRLRPFLRRSLNGEYATAAEALAEWCKLHVQASAEPLSVRTSSWLKITFACSILLFICTVIYVLP